MRIRTRLQIGVAVLMLVLAVAGVVIALTSRQARRAAREHDAAHSVVEGLFGLNILTHDCAMRPGERARAQWSSKHAAIAAILSGLDYHSPSCQADIKKMRGDHKSIGELFARLAADEAGGTGKEGKAHERSRETLVTQLLMRSHEMVGAASRLSQHSEDELADIWQRFSWAMMASLMMIAVVMAGVSFRVNRGLVRPVSQLRKGTEIVGAGNLDFRVGTDATDEIGELSRAFDKMTENLQAVTASRAELESEITERKRAEERQRLVARILDVLNRSTKEIDAIREILLLIKEVSGMEAVGIRLRKGEDFPYYETNGFPGSFVEAERYLCARDQAGQLIRDSQGNPVLECMCGNVICGRTDPSLPFFTEGGSFWSNNTTALLASTTEEERQAKTRNRCNGEGYESVALVPLRSGSETVGLLQLNDSRKDMFTSDLIAFYEEVGASVGISLARARAEEEVKQYAAQLKASNKELEAFAYSVSHDLRAPLRGMDGFSQALLEDYSGKLDEKGRHYLDRVRTAAQRMGMLIEDLLKLSRIARQEMRRERVDLSALAREVAAELKESEPSRDVAVSIQDGLVVDGDENLLRVMLQNLLGNAWKFTGKRAKAVIEFGAVEHEGETAYFVRDDGAGFDMAYADKLFGAFQRLHAESEFQGTGIGLATMQRIIHRHGGRVWAEGKVGKGATFYFTM